MIVRVLLAAMLLQGPATPRTGTVAGQVLAGDGVPAAAVRVAAVPAPPPDARPQDGSQYYEAAPPVGSALTNGQGRYRLANLPPGRYYIVAGILGQATYFPSTLNAAEATVITVGAGSAQERVDVRLASAYGGRVRGRVTPAPSTGSTENAVLSGLRLEELLEVPVAPDGAFDFGHVPKGAYLLSLFPTPPGVASIPFQVGESDVNTLEVVKRPLRTVTGRIAVQRGPLPSALFAFATPTSYVPANINPDGTFTARLHQATHTADLGGLPVGYSLASVRLGNQDVSKGLAVGATDVAGLVITVSAPQHLPSLRGRVEGASSGRGASTVEITGPINGPLSAPVRTDGSFEFAALVPGLYTVRLSQVPAFAPVRVVVGSTGAEVTLRAAAR